MDREALKKHVEISEALLRQIIDRIQTGMSGEDPSVAQIIEFLDVGEFGLAFEGMLYLAVKWQVKLPTAVYSLIEEAGRRLNLDPSEWERIRLLVTEDC